MRKITLGLLFFITFLQILYGMDKELSGNYQQGERLGLPSQILLEEEDWDFFEDDIYHFESGNLQFKKEINQKFDFNLRYEFNNKKYTYKNENNNQINYYKLGFKYSFGENFIINFGLDLREQQYLIISTKDNFTYIPHFNFSFSPWKNTKLKFDTRFRAQQYSQLTNYSKNSNISSLNLVQTVSPNLKLEAKYYLDYRQYLDNPDNNIFKDYFDVGFQYKW